MLKPRDAHHLKKPVGLFGHLVARYLDKRNSPIYQEIQEHLELENPMSLLEIGFGTGFGIRQLLRAYPGLKVTGVDFSEVMTSQASWRLRKAVKSGQVKLLCADFNTYDAGGELFDRVFFTNVIYFWDDYRSSLARIYFMLKSGGKLVFQMADGETLLKNPVTSTSVFHHYDYRDVLRVMEELGFVHVSARALTCREGHFFLTGTRP